MIRSCIDNDEKVVLRTYDWDGKLVQFRLCHNHSYDEKFSGHISEILIKQEVI